MDKGLIGFLFVGPLIFGPLSLIAAPIVWTLLEHLAKVRISFAVGFAIPFMTIFSQTFILRYVELYVSYRFASNSGLVLVSIGVAAVQYSIFRITLRQGSGQPIRPIHALATSVVNVGLCSILLKWVF